MFDFIYLMCATLYIFGGLSWKHLLYVVLTAPLFFILKKLWNFFMDFFWLGFKAGIKEEARLGRPLTREEMQALQAKVRAKAEKKVEKLLKDDED